MQKAETIRYTTRQSSLGPTIIATSRKGVCALLIDDDEEALQQELRRRFPKAQLAPADADCHRLADMVLTRIDAPAAPIDFPVDARGSAFQQRVWAALRKIPPGRTASYADIARAIDAPTAMRAVAGACAANPVAIAIPCHRVLRSDGALSGYRWGVDRKRELLAREGVQTR
jgi:AraC family transcriptional regulator, regulatory protein of adaptative response / methylated-DNA-[protein]-cysteine methyltransferase